MLSPRQLCLFTNFTRRSLPPHSPCLVSHVSPLMPFSHDKALFCSFSSNFAVSDYLLSLVPNPRSSKVSCPSPTTGVGSEMRWFHHKPQTGASRRVFLSSLMSTSTRVGAFWTMTKPKILLRSEWRSGRVLGLAGI